MRLRKLGSPEVVGGELPFPYNMNCDRDNHTVLFPLQ